MTRLNVVLFLAFGLALSACGPNRTVPPRPIWDGDTGVPSPLGCVPNLDGQIVASELMPAYDVGASFLLSPTGEERDVLTSGCSSHPDARARVFLSGLGVMSITLASTWTSC